MIKQPIFQVDAFTSTFIELGAWLLKKVPHVQEQLTVFKSVGLAIQDLGVAQVVYQNALKMNLGSTFKLN